MIFWSTGTGESTLDIPLGEAEMLEEGNYLVIKGRMGAPVFWDYKMTLNAEDFISFFSLAKDPNMVDFLVYSKNWWRLFFTVAMSSAKFILMTIIGFSRFFLTKRKNGQEVPGVDTKSSD